MDAITCLETRRSVRKFTGEPVSHETLQEIIKTTALAPSWKNTQVIRYTVVENKDIINAIAETAVLGFTFNTKTLSRATQLVVQSAVKGICGFEPDGTPSTSKGDGWEMYDAGISAQTFCLAAHAHGVGSVIMGVIDDDKIASLIGLPENETVTALIPVGYPVKASDAPPRKSVDELLRFV